MLDVVGIGFGPSNIALAIAMEEEGYAGRALFLERSPAAQWHGDMLLGGSDIQNNPLRDLATPRNPRSKYSFVNFIHQSGRFFEYLNLGLHHPLRKDFYRYVEWAADQIRNVRYNTEVTGLRAVRDRRGPAWSLTTSRGERILARAVVLGTGRKLNIPAIPGVAENGRIVHLTGYLGAVARLRRSATVAVLGSSQSAVEILLDLRAKGFRRILGIHRNFSFRLKDTSPFSDEVYFPQFVDYYHGLPVPARESLDGQLRATNYSSADGDVIHRLYAQIYEDDLDGDRRISVYRNHDLARVVPGRRLGLKLRERYKGTPTEVQADLLVLATGFLDLGRNGALGLPRLLRPMAGRILRGRKEVVVDRDYRMNWNGGGGGMPPLYLNGLCESSHGLGDAGSFSLVSLRAKDILDSLNGLGPPEAPAAARPLNRISAR